jgi:hypothetical protein
MLRCGVGYQAKAKKQKRVEFVRTTKKKDENHSMSTIPQNPQLIKNLFELIEAHRGIFKQEQTYQRALAMILAEIFVFARHTISQLILSLGMNAQDWSAWYRMFSAGRFVYDKASEVLFEETLKHVDEVSVYVIGIDSTQIPRSSRQIEGSRWARNPLSPRFMMGLHMAQRWLNGSWMLPEEAGYSRAVPIRWLPAFTVKSRRKVHEARSEWQVALDFSLYISALT